jgi:uncharacterized membrane protein
VTHTTCFENAEGLRWTTRPNRSLSVRGRLLWIVLIGLNALLISVMACLIGAWPIVPFAGLEVALVALAFWWIGRHDFDYEMLEISDGGFTWERRSGSVFEDLKGNLAWAIFGWAGRHQQTCLVLHYAGRKYELGASVPADIRQRLAQGISRQAKGRFQPRLFG